MTIRRPNIWKRLLLHHAAIAALWGLASCAGHDLIEPLPTEPPEEGLRISFRMATRTPSTTRAGETEGITELEGISAENILDVDDIRYLVFDSDGNFLSDTGTTAVTVVANQEYTLYEVTADLNAPYFLENIGGTLDFYILALANYSGWSMTLPELQPGDPIAEVFGGALTMKGTPDAARLRDAANPDVADRMYFPMAGIQRFTLAGNLLETAFERMPFDISYATGKQLDMLRALAKIEMVDRINLLSDTFDPATDGGADNMMRISGVRLDGYMAAGTLLPYMAQWKPSSTEGYATRQVTGATPAASDLYRFPPPLADDLTVSGAGDPEGCSLLFVEDAQATAARADRCPVYSCYIFEYDPAALRQDFPQRAFQAYITVTTRDNTVFHLPLAEYDGGTATAQLTPLLRNHIYRYEISAIGQGIGIDWTVCPMEEASTDIIFN